jgi:phage terminase large subunit-like protein
LWDEVDIEKARIRVKPELKRIVVSIDPATSKKPNSDETGITVVGIDGQNKGYVLEDISGQYSPSEWASTALSAVQKWGADCIVA